MLYIVPSADSTFVVTGGAAPTYRQFVVLRCTHEFSPFGLRGSTLGKYQSC